uniref:Uncharacterized protein n=1 Tax=Picea sitchensis TaxID=3332 RepID=A9NM04_PICSI|nr:unknown [Picea sitchensis]
MIQLTAILARNAARRRSKNPLKLELKNSCLQEKRMLYLRKGPLLEMR